MKEPYRRKNLHSIISKISGQASEGSETEQDNTVVDQEITTETEKREMKLPEQHLSDNFISKTDSCFDKTTTSLTDCSHTVGPYSCKSCHVGFLTRRELQLHVMCHGISITDDGNSGTKQTTPQLTMISGNDSENDSTSRNSPVIQKNSEKTSRSGSSSSEFDDSRQASPVQFTMLPLDNKSMKKIIETQDPITSTINKTPGKNVDVLSMATATRGFKEPGSIWCSFCKCTVEVGHVCKIHQNFQVEKKEEGFTCELCGRYYNHKRKLRTHLRNRHKGFRLQEDEGYMCWQCWQAFPEIKILEEHIVTVHGHESRRQNSTWRLLPPTSGETTEDHNSSEPTTSHQNPNPPTTTATTAQSLKRPHDENIVSPTPHKKITTQDDMDLGSNNHIQPSDSIPERRQSKSPNQTSVIARSPPSTPGIQSPPPKETTTPTTTTSNVNLGGTTNPTYYTTQATNVVSQMMTQPLKDKRRQPGSPPKIHDCPHCSEKFNKKYILQLHIENTHSDNMHCFFCSTSCATKEELTQHLKSIHAEEVRLAKCPVCQCKCLGELDQHIIQYHMKDLLMKKEKEKVLCICPICNETTADTYHLRWHIMKEHPNQRHLYLGVNDQLMLEESGSESSGSVTSEGTRSTTTEITTGVKTTTEDIEIVYISDKMQNNGKTCQSDVVSTPSVKSQADSSNGLEVSGPLIADKLTADSTTGHIIERKAVSPHMLSGLVIPKEYLDLSEKVCIFCYETFPAKDNLIAHLTSTHGWSETFTCPICYQQSENYAKLVEHFCMKHFHPINDTLSQTELKCVKCGIIFPDINHLKKHSSALHSFQLPASATYDTFKCRHCNIIFYKQFDAQKHFDIYHLFRIRFKCESCRMGFTAKQDFQEHVTCNHPELIKTCCPLCGLGFEVNTDLEEHVFEMHRKKAQFFCAQCKNEFTDRFHVHMHIRSNCCVKWADSNFECLDCLTAFSTIAELRIHCNMKNCKK